MKQRKKKTPNAPDTWGFRPLPEVKSAAERYKAENHIRKNTDLLNTLLLTHPKLFPPHATT